MLDDYFDDNFTPHEGEGWKLNKNKKKKLSSNPNGHYKIEDFLFRGILWSKIIIENVTHDEFKVTASTEEEDINKEDLDSLRSYLSKEGFEQAARKHNLFW